MAQQRSILAVSGSLRTNSSNTNILLGLANEVPYNIRYSIYDGLDGLPHFNPALDGNEAPQQVLAWRRQIAAADAVIICTPEYAFGVPGSLKNALDWTVSSGEFVGKPVALITASSVGEHAHAALLLTLGAISANVINGATLLIPFIRSKMDASGNITDHETARHITDVFHQLILSINGEPTS
jgi:chromate reductase